MALSSGRDGAAEGGFPRKVPMSRPAYSMASSAAVFVSLALSAACLLAYSGMAPAWGQSGPSLAGKNVQMLIGFGPGGGYDLWGRAVARHIGRHLAGNPTVVPQNMPGAGSFVAA